MYSLNPTTKRLAAYRLRPLATLTLALAAAGGLARCDRPDSADRALPQPAGSVPRRIIALAPSTVEIVCDLGAADRLVAVGRYCDYPPEIAGLPRVGGMRDPDLERIVVLKPDLLMLRGANDSLQRLADRHAMRVYHDPSDTLADIERAVREIGELLGLSDRADEIVSRMRRRFAKLRQAVAGRPAPRVLFTTRSPAQLANIYTVAKGSYLSELIELAGGRNIFGEQDAPYPLVGLDEILARQPEVIIESLFDAEPGPRLQERVMDQWRQVGSLPAVESGRIHVLVADYATVPSPRVVEMAADLVGMIHPEVTLDAD